jgi:hypothetical protein
MPAAVSKLSQPQVAGVLGALALSVVRAGTSTLAMRSVRWYRDLERVGVRTAFPVVHDLGLLFAAPADQLLVGARADVGRLLGRFPGGTELGADYERLVAEVAHCEAARRAQALRLPDDMIAVVLSKVLAPACRKASAPPPYPTDLAADASLFELDVSTLEGLFARFDRTFELRALGALRDASLHVLTLADALDLDTLRLLGVLGAEGQGGEVQVDLLAAMDLPSANDVVNFSLEILPSVLEAKVRAGLSTRSGHGWGGIGRRGGVDSLVLTELAWDRDDFVRRVLDDEALYYAKETVAEPAGRRSLLLVDASASMRGDRHVFARGMALATAKKLVLQGQEVTFRFFDSRLYEALRSRGGALPTASVLSFQGERGRNPARVFAELAAQLDVERARDRREVDLYVFTHAALYIPRELVAEARRRCRLCLVFILPSTGRLDLDYLDLVDAHWTVDHATLAERGARAQRARQILGDIGTRAVGGRPAGAGARAP